MSDTQWPRYEIFIQDKPDKPFKAVGSVHAVDSEMALLNARTVFVRRPRCHAMWLVPANVIYAKTLQEIEAGLEPVVVDDSQPNQIYCVFQKQSHRRSMTYVTHIGQVEATTGAHALQLALHTFTDTQGLVWWVLPASAITRTSEEDIDSLFEPALDKAYRQQTFYPNTRMP